MGKKGRDRQRRSRFDDDTYSGPDVYQERPYQDRSYQERPRTPFRGADATPSGPAAEATVKWFNPEKGFGFVELADGSGDAFLHIGVLQNAGHEAVAPGTKLKVEIGQGQKGPQVTGVLEVDASSAAAPQPARRPPPAGGGRVDRGRADPSTASDVEGTVKWFNPEKGFGFAGAEDGEKDVFIHISVVERSGISGLQEGQRLSMRVVKTQKGREAISLKVAE